MFWGSYLGRLAEGLSLSEPLALPSSRGVVVLAGTSLFLGLGAGLQSLRRMSVGMLGARRQQFWLAAGAFPGCRTAPCCAAPGCQCTACLAAVLDGKDERRNIESLYKNKS